MRPLAVAVLLACLAVPGASYARAQLEGPALVRIFSETQGSAVDVAVHGERTAGDREFRGVVLEDRRGKRIGYGSYVCVYLGRVLPTAINHCTAVFVLPRGRIIAEGTRHRRDYYVFAVTGGTGLYSNASGTLIASTWSLRGARRERLLFSLET